MDTEQTRYNAKSRLRLAIAVEQRVSLQPRGERTDSERLL